VGGFEKVAGARADDHARGHGVAGGHVRHNGPIGGAQVGHAVHPWLTVNHGVLMLVHFGGSGLVPKGGGITQVVYQGRPSEGDRHHLAFSSGSQAALVNLYRVAISTSYASCS
jgi:hypothetical protein